MEKIRYWMIFQTLLGIWMIVSPFALGYREVTGLSINNLVVGAVVAIVGLMGAFWDLAGMRHREKKPA
mgnify:CR=1 FL=1